MIPELRQINPRKKEIIENLWPLVVTATPNKIGFARQVCEEELNTKYFGYQEVEFADGERFFQFGNNLRDREVFIITSTEQLDDKLVDALILSDAAKLSGAASRVTIIFTYFGWARADRKDAPRKSLAVATIAKLFKTVNVDRVMILDPHFSQLQAIFYALDIKCDLLFGSGVLAEYIRRFGLKNFAVASVDGSGQKIVKDYSERFKVPYYLTFKERHATDQTRIVGENGNKIEIKTILGADDLTSTLGSLLEAAKNYKQRGVEFFYGAVTHFVATEKNVEAILKALDNPLIDGLFATDSVSFPEKVGQHPKIQIAPLKELVAYVIFNTYYRRSISQLFKKNN